MPDDAQQLPLTVNTPEIDTARPKSAAQRKKESRERQRAARARDPELDKRLRERDREHMRRYRDSAKVQADRTAKRAQREERKESTRHHRNGKKREARAAVPRTFVAFDGEAVTLDDGREPYVLLATSTGDTLHNPDGLSTHEALTFLFDVKSRAPKTKCHFVGFRIDYDLNMILHDLTREQAEQLWKTHKLTVIMPATRYPTVDAPRAVYRFDWIPTKRLRVTRRYKKTFTNDAGQQETVWSSPSTLTLEDVFGFFQSSFLKAIDDWQIGSDEQRDFIAEYKAKRGDFRLDDLDNVTAYNKAECDLLQELCEKLAATMDSLGIEIRDWIGAGAIAGALLRTHNIRDHKGDEYMPDGVKQAAFFAYFGGRIQNLQTGLYDRVYAYDIHSAYPAAAITLPSLKGTWRHVSGKRCYEPDAPWSVWKVTWELDNRVPVTPFPYRRDNGAVYYPCTGTGWYWQPEVAAARELATRSADGTRWDVDVSEGWIFEPANPSTRPFAFLHDIYHQRAAYKAAGDAREKPLKLGINSVYGKLAQGVAYDREQEPPYRSFVWAGLITSLTRATMYRAAMQNPHAVIGFATDGLLTTAPFDVPLSDDLGDWEQKTIDDLFTIKPGFYQSFAVAKIKRTRGFSPDQIPATRWETIRADWLRHADLADRLNVTYQIPNIKRFIGMGTALSYGPDRWSEWCTWRTFDAGIRPQYKARSIPVPLTDRTVGYRPYAYTAFTEQRISARYTPKSDAYTIAHDDDPDAVQTDALEDVQRLQMLEDEQPDYND